MPLTARSFAGFVLVASAGVLVTALLSQFWGGLDPCELCLYERWPWDAALVIAAVSFAVPRRLGPPAVAVVLAAIFALGAALAFYHVGVEHHWFAGPSACTASGTGATTLAQMREELEGRAPVMCDQVQWSLFGVSLAGWNFLASFLMAAFCLAAARGTTIRRAAA